MVLAMPKRRLLSDLSLSAAKLSGVVTFGPDDFNAATPADVAAAVTNRPKIIFYAGGWPARSTVTPKSAIRASVRST